MPSKEKLLNTFQKNQWFRAGAGAIITNKHGKVLAFERTDVLGAWQFPQGGMDAGELPLETVYREVEEETGIQQEHLLRLTETNCLLAYELPEANRLTKNSRGQIHYWYLFRLTAAEDVISLGDKKEFKQWKWMSMQEMIDVVVAFRKPVYRALAEFMQEEGLLIS